MKSAIFLALPLLLLVVSPTQSYFAGKGNESAGKVAYGLQQAQFRVFENGFEQEIVYFEAPQARYDLQSNPGL